MTAIVVKKLNSQRLATEFVCGALGTEMLDDGTVGLLAKGFEGTSY
mgnify:CR=1 FL=1